MSTRKGDVRMMSKNELIDQVRAIAKSASERGAHSIQLKYAGGEPLLPKVLDETIIPAQSEIEAIVKEYDLELEQVVITNGYFLEQSVEKLKRISNLKVSVSVWGVGSRNDELRNNKLKDSSFERIVKGLKLLQKNKIPFSIHHVIGFDANNLKKFIEVMWNVDSPDFIGRDEDGFWRNELVPIGFNIFRPQTKEQLESMIKSKTYDLIANGINKALLYMLELVKQGKRVQALTSFDYLDLTRLKSRTCGAGFNYIVIESGKKAQPCHQLLSSGGKAEETELDIIRAVNEKIINEPAIMQDKPDFINQQLWELLAFHGGGGCPLAKSIREEAGVENKTVWVYSQIMHNWLNLLAHKALEKYDNL